MMKRSVVKMTELRIFKLVMILLCTGVTTLGCGTKEGLGNDGDAGAVIIEDGFAKVAAIETNPNNVVVSDVGSASESVVVVTGTGKINLEINGFEVTGNPAYALTAVKGCRVDGCSDKWDSSTADLRNLGAPIVIGIEGTPYSYVEVIVGYDPALDATGGNATLTIFNNADGKTQKQVDFSTLVGEPEIAVYPQEVDFGSVQVEQIGTESILIENSGTANLLITTIDFQGPSVFSIEIDEVEYPIGVLDFSSAPLVIPGLQQKEIYVHFAPINSDPATASVKLISNASNTESGGEEVILKGNNSGPKIVVNPSLVNFGANPVGQLSVLPVQIQSTGTETLVINKIDIAEEGEAGSFSLDFSQVEGFEDGSKPSAEKPLILEINRTAEIQVRFTPSVESAKDENNQLVPEKALITIQNNSFDGAKEVEVTGTGFSGNCPVAVIEIKEGEQVIPQTTLNLFGDQSFSPAGVINKWEWSVDQPDGSQSLFLPSANFPNPTFEANAAGQYIFKLTVWDDNQTPSCVPDEAELVVIPDEAIHVELLWNTPNDSDQTDHGPEAGADLDLHFMHPYAAGPDLDGDGSADGWFDAPYDCFWFNPAPQWASWDLAIDDDPGLDRDDTDGAGPENLNLNIPEAGTTYKVGVHYWADNGFGSSYATVRVYIYGDLVFEIADQKMVNHDMWEVCTIDWPSGTVKQIEDGFKIIPDYVHPAFAQLP